MSVAEFGAGAPDVFGGDGVAGGAVPVDVMPIFPSGGRLLAAQAARDEVGAVDGELDLLVQDLAHELAVALVADRLRQLGRQDLGRVAPLVLLEELHDHVQVAELIVEKALPDLLDSRIGLALQARVVVVDLVGLVQQPLLQPGLVGVDDGAVLGDVLLLDGQDLGVQRPRHRVGVGRPEIHVEVVGLVLGGEDGECVETADGRSRVAVVMLAKVVFGVSVLVDGRPPHGDVSVALSDVVGVLAFQPVQQRRIAVEVIEVLQHAEAIDLGEIGVGLVLGDAGGDLDRHLLVGDGGLQPRLVRRQQPVDQCFLVVLDATYPRQQQPQMLVEQRTVVREAVGLVLDAVHQDDPDPRHGIVVELADRLGRELTPGEFLSLQRHAFLFHEMKSHRVHPPSSMVLEVAEIGAIAARTTAIAYNGGGACRRRQRGTRQ